jgi:predicted aspartyl protease
METREMGRVVVEARIENMKDLWEVESGQRAADEARSVTITDALIDTGVTGLSLPSKFIQQLGLSKTREFRLHTSGGPRSVSVYEAVRLTILDRDCTVDVVEAGDGLPSVIGQIPLGAMDFVVDSTRQRLIGNPAHGGQWVSEAY